MRKGPITDQHTKIRAFMAAYSVCMNVDQAIRIAGIKDGKQLRDWLRWNEAYRKSWEEHQETVAQNLELEAIRRAYEGVQRPVLYKGKVVRTGRGRNSRILYETEYSDQLMITLLKRFRPQHYRERTMTEVTGSIDIVERLQAARARLVKMQAEKPEDQAS